MISSTNTVGTTPKDSSTAKAPKNRSAHTSHSYVSTAECRFSPASASPSCAASATGSPSRAAISSSEYPSASLKEKCCWYSSTTSAAAATFLLCSSAVSYVTNSFLVMTPIPQ